MIQIVQNLHSVSINTDEIELFSSLKALMSRNFSKILGKKYKIFAFFDENEIPQRKYFLKFAQRCFEKNLSENSRVNLGENSVNFKANSRENLDKNLGVNVAKNSQKNSTNLNGKNAENSVNFNAISNKNSRKICAENSQKNSVNFNDDFSENLSEISQENSAKNSANFKENSSANFDKNSHKLPQKNSQKFTKNLGLKLDLSTQDFDLSELYHKTIRLNFKQENAIKPLIAIVVEFTQGGLIFKLNANEKPFVQYVKQYFRHHECEYDETGCVLVVAYKDATTIALFENFARENEHLKYCVDFCIDEAEFAEFKQKCAKKAGEKWKFNALAKLFSSYFEILECTPENNLAQIRQKYLILVKRYHPDAVQNAVAADFAGNLNGVLGNALIAKNAASNECLNGEISSEILSKAREKFDKIQIAYNNLKALYKHNA